MRQPPAETAAELHPVVGRRAPFVWTLLGAAFCSAAVLGSSPYWPKDDRAWWWTAAYAPLVAAAAWMLTRIPRDRRGFSLALGVLALGARLAWSLNVVAPPLDDYLEYRSGALNALHGNWYPIQHTFWPWGNFLWLYVIAHLFGPSLRSALAVNALAGAGTTLLVYAIGWRLMGERAGRIAGVMYAVCPAALLWSGILCAEIPHLLLLLAGLLALLMGTGAAGDTPDASAAPKLRLSPSHWLIAGGLLLAAADFFRPVSPLLLAPATLYLLRRRERVAPTQPGRSSAGRSALPPVAAYGVGVAAFLLAKSLATGYLNLTPSYTMGLNLACGLSWRAQGVWNAPDDAVVMISEDPREINRAGMALAGQRARELLTRDQAHLLALPVRKFPTIWSNEGSCYFTTAAALRAEGRSRHWVIRCGIWLYGLAQFYHLLILCLAGIGFWRQRRSVNLTLLGGIIIAFALFHAVFEVQDRYHFAVEALLTIAAGCAFLPAGLAKDQAEPLCTSE